VVVRGARARRVLAALLLVTLLLAPTAGCTTTPPEPAPTPQAVHTWDQTHRVDLLPGWTATARNVGLLDESTSLSGPGSAGCLVNAWPSPPERYSRPLSPRTVSVQGRDAEYGELDRQYGPYPRAVVWTDADGRWFGVACDLDESGILRVAEGVHAGPNPVRVPFRLRSSIEGASLIALIEDRRGKVPAMTAQLETTGPGRTESMQISSGAEQPPDDGPVVRERIGDHVVEVRRRSQTMCLPTRSVPLCIFGPGGEPATDWSESAYPVARRAAELLEPVGDPTDQATWIDADKAFPR
jgi:hypothetical protein